MTHLKLWRRRRTMENMFQVGDLVSHKKRGYTGVVVEVLDKWVPPDFSKAIIYKITWEHGAWMYEMEDQLILEAKATSE